MRAPKIILAFIGILLLLAAMVAADSRPAGAQQTCVSGDIGSNLERICDPQTGIICYRTAVNGYGVKALSCVRP